VWTAGEGVLEGTVRRLVLEVCEKNGILVVLQPPLLSDLERWEGAFISSTSRLALPIDWIGVPKEGEEYKEGDLCRNFASSDLLNRIVKLVSESVEKESTEVW